MDDQFFSLDSLLSDAYLDLLADGRPHSAVALYHLRHEIAQENNQ
jgi:hypothetical protein